MTQQTRSIVRFQVGKVGFSVLNTFFTIDAW
jgi:hypothetical protein